MLCNTTTASFAMLAPERHTDHTRNTEVGLVELPQAEKLVNNGLLRAKTTKFWNITRLVEHRAEVEVSAKGI